MYDDFIEQRPGAAEELEESLNKCPTGTSSSGPSHVVSNSFSPFEGATNYSAHVQQPSGTGIPTPNLPQGYDPHPPNSGRTSTVVECDPERRWLLVCAKGKKRPISLAQLDVCSTSSDKELFREVRKIYASVRSRWSQFFSLRTIQSIKFVQVCIQS